MSSVAIAEPNIQVGQTLHSSLSDYSILEFIGEGSFGKVAKCQNLRTGETVAIKVLKKDPHLVQDAEHEVSILETISVLDPDSTNVVKFFEQFDFMEQTCLAFEMLEANLYDLFEHNDWDPMHLKGIRPIAKQLFVALAALKTLGILHTDIKPDNIMIVREQEESLRVKLIDFGLAIPAAKVQLGMVVQPTGYRAPEVALGLPFTEAIDVWGVGCILGFLFLAENLFPVFCNYRMMKRMVEILGLPAHHQLWNGGYTHQFFALEETPFCQNWRLQTPEEFAQKNGEGKKESDTSYILPTSLDDMMDVYPEVVAGETEDTGAFVDLMKGLLRLEGSQRLTPTQALQHPFITMTHLSQNEDFSDYLNKSQLKMSCCLNTGVLTGPDEDSDSWHSLPLGEATDGPVFQDVTPTLFSWDNLSFIDEHDSDDSGHGSEQSSIFEDGQSDQSSDEISESLSQNSETLSLNGDQESHEEEAPTDSQAPTSTSSGGLRKRLTRFFRSLKRRALRTFCCIRPAEE